MKSTLILFLVLIIFEKAQARVSDALKSYEEFEKEWEEIYHESPEVDLDAAFYNFKDEWLLEHQQTLIRDQSLPSLIEECFMEFKRKLKSVESVMSRKIDLPDDLDEMYKKFKKEFKKAAKSLLQDKKNKIEFIKNFNIINAHNKKFESDPDVSFDMKINQFADIPRSERLLHGNVIPSVEFAELMVRGKSVEIVNNTMFPPSNVTAIDWTTSNCITPVKDQGTFCNNCWAFSGIAGLEAHHCLKNGKRVSMSEQQLVDCNRNDETGNWGCSGGSQASAYMYIYGNDGIQSDSTYPYQEDIEHPGNYPCRYDSTNKVATTNGYWRIRPFNETLLKDVVTYKGPVVAAMSASYDSFYFYSSGIYDDPNCQPGTSHSVLVVGFGTSKRGTDFWICKNSWSTNWGMGGYFRIRRGVNRCGITGYLIYPDV